MAKCVMVLYPDPIDGYPPRYARDSIPVLDGYPDGSTLPTPSAVDFTPGELLGCVSGALGLRKFFADNGHELVVTSDKDGPDSVFERELADADIVISQPFWPAYLTAERIARAPKLKLALTAGIGSDHVDLDAARKHGITVAEETYSNSISVAEHTVLQTLALVRNFVPSHRYAVDGGWNIADCVARAYDVEGMDFGVIAAGRIGRAVLERMKPFGVRLHYTDIHRLPESVEQELGVTFHPDVASLARAVDIVSIHSPLYADTRGMFDEQLIGSMRRGSYLVNTARAEDRPGRGGGGAGERPPRRLRRGRLVSAAAGRRPPVAVDAEPRDDPARVGQHPVGAGPLRRGHPRDPRGLAGRPAHPPRVPDRAGR